MLELTVKTVDEASSEQLRMYNRMKASNEFMSDLLWAYNGAVDDKIVVVVSSIAEGACELTHRVALVDDERDDPKLKFEDYADRLAKRCPRLVLHGERLFGLTMANLAHGQIDGEGDFDAWQVVTASTEQGALFTMLIEVMSEGVPEFLRQPVNEADEVQQAALAYLGTVIRFFGDDFPERMIHVEERPPIPF